MNALRTVRRASLICLLAPLICSAAAAADQAADRLHLLLQQSVDSGALSGAIVVVSRKGRTVVADAVGVSDAASKTPLKPDSVIWLASMSKPIAAAGIMMLVESGKVRLDDPISRYVPEFAAPRQVRDTSQGTAGSDAQLTPAIRAITVRDLLTHTSGLQSIGVQNAAVPQIAVGDTLASWVPRLSSVPLDFQPGSRWAYSNAVGFDVLSRVIEVASGQSLDAFLKSRLFEPLAMNSTGFRGLRGDLQSRMPPIAAALTADQRLVGTTFMSGAAGLYGSLDDYRKFAEMLLNGGKANGKRLLKTSSVTAMSSNQTRDLFHTYDGRSDVSGMAFGYSVAIVVDSGRAGLNVPNGSYGWDGAGGTRFWVMPSTRSVAVLFIPAKTVRSQAEAAISQLLAGQ